jgi:hypothetical protein
MPYCQGFTLLKIQEAKHMGKKTVLIAVQRTLERKVFMTSKGRDTGTNLAEGSFKIIPSKNG